jgi:hypothetical protein
MNRIEPIATLSDGLQVNRVMNGPSTCIGWEIGYKKDEMVMIGRDQVHLLVGILESDKQAMDECERFMMKLTRETTGKPDWSKAT